MCLLLVVQCDALYDDHTSGFNIHRWYVGEQGVCVCVCHFKQSPDLQGRLKVPSSLCGNKLLNFFNEMQV